jgi:hypothetical protein
VWEQFDEEILTHSDKNFSQFAEMCLWGICDSNFKVDKKEVWCMV